MTASVLAFYALPPLVGAVIGWFTNYLAVKLIFRPRTPRRLLGWRLQGLVPKRQPELAQAVGEVVAAELVHATDLSAALNAPEIHARVTEALERHLDDVIQRMLGSLSPIVTVFLPSTLVTNVKRGVLDEVRARLPELLAEVGAEFERHVDVRALVVAKVEALQTERLEALVLKIAARELTHIEILGAVLGFVIGAVQVLVASLAGFAP